MKELSRLPAILLPLLDPIPLPAFLFCSFLSSFHARFPVCISSLLVAPTVSLVALQIVLAATTRKSSVEPGANQSAMDNLNDQHQEKKEKALHE